MLYASTHENVKLNSTDFFEMQIIVFKVFSLVKQGSN